MATDPHLPYLRVLDEQVNHALRALEMAGAAYTGFVTSGTAGLISYERDQMLEARGLLRAAYAATVAALDPIEQTHRRLERRTKEWDPNQKD